MILLAAETIVKNYSEKTLLEGVSLNLGEGEKVGVIGVNGTGKTTLLRIIAGEEPPDSGKVSRFGAVRVSYLPQDVYKRQTQRGARPETLGMVTCFCGMVLSVGYLLADGSSWGNGKILLLGFFGGIAYAVGFFVLITSCLKIGPIGLTTAMNNMGMIGPLIIGMLLFDEAKKFTL